MKNQVTQKYIRALYGNSVFSVSYCDAQHLLMGSSPFAYSAGVYGWNCDYYNFGGVIICTGYRPHGRRCYDITRTYELAARAIYDDRSLTWEERGERIAAVRDKWISDLYKEV